MTYLLSHLPELWPWLILMAALGMGWSGFKHTALVLLGIWASVAVYLGILTPVALAVAIPGLALAAWLRNAAGTPAAISWTVLIMWSVAMGAHLAPGFNNPIALDGVLSGPQSHPFTMYLNADKPLVFFALLLAWPPLLQKERPARAVPLIMAAALALVLFPIAVAAGALLPEASWPDWIGLFILVNLLMTCLTEEAFFRGFLQTALTDRIGTAGGIAAASLLFGLVHFPAGAAVVAFATLLGAACGLGHWYGGRLRYAVWIHFGFNLIHLMFFTYPGPV